MGNPWVVDTDVMVDFLRGYDEADALIKEHADRIKIPSVVVAELYAGVRGESEKNTLDDLITVFHVLPVNAAIAKQGGLYKKEYGNSHGIGLADAIIAASASVEGADLKTLNVRHYPMFENLCPPYRKV